MRILWFTIQTTKTSSRLWNASNVCGVVSLLDISFLGSSWGSRLAECQDALVLDSLLYYPAEYLGAPCVPTCCPESVRCRQAWLRSLAFDFFLGFYFRLSCYWSLFRSDSLAWIQRLHFRINTWLLLIRVLGLVAFSVVSFSFWFVSILKTLNVVRVVWTARHFLHRSNVVRVVQAQSALSHPASTGQAVLAYYVWVYILFIFLS